MSEPAPSTSSPAPPSAAVAGAATPKQAKFRTRAPEAAPGFCKRCKDTKATVSARQAVFCRPCFLDGSMVKFRDAVARFKLPPASPSSVAVLALSGGTCSRSLLHMVVHQYFPPHTESGSSGSNVRDERHKHQHRGPFTSIRVVVIDESEVIPCDPAYIERIRTIVADYGLQLQLARLSDIFRFTEDNLVLELTNGAMSATARSPSSNTELLQAIFTGTPSVSAKEDMLRTIRSRLLTYLAAAEGDHYLLLGSSTLTLAHQVIAATVKGRGAAVPEMVKLVEGPPHHPTVLKPLANFSMKELALFAHFHHLDIVPLPTFTSGRPPGLKQGIEQVTMSFLLALEKAKEGTHSTVFKTAARLHPPAAAARVCSMCAVTPVDEGGEEVEEYKGTCRGCARTFKELQMADRRGATRTVRLPLFAEIAEHLLESDGE